MHLDPPYPREAICSVYVRRKSFTYAPGELKKFGGAAMIKMQLNFIVIELPLIRLGLASRVYDVDEMVVWGYEGAVVG
ncbi:hypothetical protein E2C01_062096 [Portunus trituberculatus]|uniref:Uncharacterized protein n=1 Tax=Portunus trituberculatus TaxID=210409 RepID=A0A5B7H711_PORTR|nr:hypothetical protein [Portunus trituberculatus]